MIETLGTIGERIIRGLSGGDIPSDSPYKMEFVIADIKDALREDLKLEILQRRSGREDDRTPVTQYIATYPNVLIQWDAVTKRCYFDLPSSYMSLKHNKGIHWVADARTPHLQMIPVANPGVTIHLPHADMERVNYAFYIEGLKGFFLRNVLRDKLQKLLLKLIVPAPDTWTIDMPLPVLPENIARVMDVVKNRQLMRVPQDRLNDGNPNLRPANA